MPAMSNTSLPRARPLQGMVFVAVAAALWGTTGTAQALAGGALSPLWFGALRLVFAALFFLAFAAATGALSRAAFSALNPRALMGAGLCMAFYNLAFFAGVQRTGVGVGTAIALGSGPVWAGLLQAVFHRQRLSGGWWAGTGLAIAGGVALSLGGSGMQFSASGMLLCLACGLSYAVYALLNKQMVGQAPAATLTLGAFGVAALVSLPAAAWQAGWPAPGLSDLVATAYTGVVTAGVGYLLFSQALRHIASATGVTLALLEPVVAFALAVLVLGEPVTSLGLGGLALVVAGVWGVARSELARPAAPSRPSTGAEPGLK